MLIVIGMIALILGLGLGLFTRFNLGDRVAATLVQNVIRSAHNWSVAREAPSRVVIDPATNTIRAQGMQVIGTWHFESLPIEGAFGLDGSNSGGHLVDDGFQGKALCFAGEPARSRAEIPVERDPSYDLREGFALQCALRPIVGHGGAVLMLGASIGIETTESGAVKAWIISEIKNDLGQAERGGRIPIECDAHALEPDRWSQVQLQYDRRHLRLLVDAVLVAELEETAPVWKIEGPLVLSPGTAPYPGCIDNLVISAVGGEESTQLPRNISFPKNTPKEIVFESGGALDRAAHREPVHLSIELDDGRQIPIVVNLYGTVE